MYLARISFYNKDGTKDERLFDENGFNDEVEFDVEDDGELAVLFMGFLYESGLIDIDRDE